MTTTVIAGGRILDQAGERSGDVLVDDETGLIVEVGPSLSGDRTLDATDSVTVPGFVDLHAHLRQPGNEAAETILSASRAAAKGGYTAVIAAPDIEPCADSASVVSDVMALGAVALCDVVPAAAISVGRSGEELAPLGELADLGVRLFSDEGHGVQNAGFMRNALDYASSVGTVDGAPLVLAQRCDVASLSIGAQMHEGEWSSRLGLGGAPAEAEELMVMRDIALARLTGARVHFQCLSTAGSIAMVRAAKAGGVAVTAEVTPHHFTFTHEACSSYDTNTKVSPPLRTTDDVAAIKAGLADGAIDAIATDHAPHAPDDKERPFDQTSAGVIGLETAFAVALTELDIDLAAIVGLLSWQPAQIAGLADRHGRTIEVGAPANLAVIDPHHRWIVKPSELSSRSRNTPFAGRELTGKVRHTIHHATPVVENFEATR